VLTADAGYPSAANLAARERRRLDADIPDVGYRTHDPRVAAPQHHRDTPDPLDDQDTRTRHVAAVQCAGVPACPGPVVLPLPGGQTAVSP
jgi:hypothetical protein